MTTPSLLLLLAAIVSVAAQAPAGLSIERDDAEILLGEAGDVRLARGDGGALSVSGEVVANGTALLAAVRELVADVTVLRQTVSEQAAVLATQATEISTLKGQLAAFDSLSSKAAIDAAIASAAEPGVLAKEVTDALGVLSDETALNDAISSAAADGVAAKAVTDALGSFSAEASIQNAIDAAAASPVSSDRLLDGSVTSAKLAAAAVTREKLETPTQFGRFTPVKVSDADSDHFSISVGSHPLLWRMDGPLLNIVGQIGIGSTLAAGNVDIEFPPEAQALLRTIPEVRNDLDSCAGFAVNHVAGGTTHMPPLRIYTDTISNDSELGTTIRFDGAFQDPPVTYLLTITCDLTPA